MPYIYSLAGDVYHRDATIMRGLVMDFPNDVQARDINDQYLFGHALLVAPVTDYRARSRSVYFPQGADWYDLLTGQKFGGGRSVTVEAGVDKIPVYVRAGSILPTGPAIQYTAEKLDGPLTLIVYTGADGVFSLYEDQGVNYAKGVWHHPLLALHDTSDFLIIDRSGPGDNCEERFLEHGAVIPVDSAI